MLRGFIEQYGEDCFAMLREFLNNRLDIDPTHVYIARGHRHGQRNPQRQHNSRPMIANVRDFCDIETIMSRGRMLKARPFR